MVLTTSCSKKSTETIDTDIKTTPDERSQRGKKNSEAPRFTEILRQMDSNGDGKISKSEAKGPMIDQFSKIDSNEDGQITADEYKHAPRPNRKRGQRSGGS